MAFQILTLKICWRWGLLWETQLSIFWYQWVVALLLKRVADLALMLWDRLPRWVEYVHGPHQPLWACGCLWDFVLFWPPWLWLHIPYLLVWFLLGYFHPVPITFIMCCSFRQLVFNLYSKVYLPILGQLSLPVARRIWSCASTTYVPTAFTSSALQEAQPQMPRYMGAFLCSSLYSVASTSWLCPLRFWQKNDWSKIMALPIHCRKKERVTVEGRWGYALELHPDWWSL